MPLQFKLIEGKIIPFQVEKLGFTNSPLTYLKREDKFFIPFLRTCFSLGDWGIISRLPEILKTYYPNSKIYLPTTECILNYFEPFFKEGNWKESNPNPELTPQWIFKNNPYIDGYFNTKDIQGEIFTDHHRINNDKINEPLVEKIAKFFNIPEDFIQSIDTTPKLYFTQDEISKAKSLIKGEYGCLLLGSRINNFNYQWEFDHYLKPYAEKYKHIPVFYYSSFDLNNTWWDEYFPNRISFNELKLTFREQLCVKSLALFNIGYQAGITDSVAGNCNEIITLTPYTEDKLGSNIIRGVKYVFNNGNEKIY
jgi:hypothetical protein